MKTTVRILLGAIVAIALIIPTAEIHAVQSSVPQYNGYRGGKASKNDRPGKTEKPNKPSKPDKPSGNRPNGGRPGGNPGGLPNRPNNGHRPNSGNPGGTPNRPNNGHKPNGGSPGGIINRPTGGHRPDGRPHIDRPPHPGHPTFSPAPPPYRPNRPCWKPVPRPHRPLTFVPYSKAPILNTFLGLSFGLSLNNSINLLWSSGYDIDGYSDREIYLRDVKELGYRWEDAIAYYDWTGRLTSISFSDSSSRFNLSRYNKLQRKLSQLYGPPANSYQVDNMLQTAWFDRFGEHFITLSYELQTSFGGQSRYYTTLSYGYN